MCRALLHGALLVIATVAVVIVVVIVWVVVCLLYTSLSLTWENYARLPDNEKGLGLFQSVDNYDPVSYTHLDVYKRQG